MSTEYTDGLVLSTGANFKADDGCDYTNVIIHRLQARSRACCRAPFIPEPKPIKINLPPVFKRTKPKLGKRKSYSYNVMLAIHQLNRLGINEKVISQDLSMPVNNIRQILAHETRTSHKAKLQAHQCPLPTKSEILNRMNQEI